MTDVVLNQDKLKILKARVRQFREDEKGRSASSSDSKTETRDRLKQAVENRVRSRPRERR